jgi:hypothetical protein
MELNVFERASLLVEEAVSQHAEKWSTAVGLAETHDRFGQFVKDVTEALHACMRAHIMVAYHRYPRPSVLRKDLLALANAASEAATKLYNVRDILAVLPPMHDDPAFRLAHDPQSTAFELCSLAKRSRERADMLKKADRGGKTPMRAFDMLARGLVTAYQRATGQTGAGRAAREGALLDLCKAVLPQARKLAKAITDQALETPSDRGEYLYRVARRHRGALPSQ